MAFDVILHTIDKQKIVVYISQDIRPLENGTPPKLVGGNYVFLLD